MGSINLKHTGSGSAIALSSDGTSLLLNGTAIGGGGGGGSPDLYADNYDGTSTAPSATGTNAIALGYSSVASGSRSLALIQGSTASGNRSIAAGLGAIASATNSIAIGSNNATASASAAIALGQDSTASGQYAIALGKSQASTDQGFAVQINNNTTSYGASGVFGSTAIGNTAKATGSVAIALGQGSIASGSKALAFGTGATASSGNSVAIGYNTTANVTDGVAIGGSGKPVKISGTYTLPIADGTNGQVMTTDGSGSVTFADAGGGGGGSYTLLSTTTVSSTVSELIVALSGTYQEYRVVVQNWITDSTNGGNDIMMRAGTDASTFASGSADYTHALRYTRIGSSGAADGSHTNAGKTFLQLSNYAIDGTVAQGGLYMNMGITNPHSTTYPTAFHWNMNHGSETGGTNAINNVVGSGLLLTTIANTTHLRFSFAGSGTANQFSAGVFKVYGVS